MSSKVLLGFLAGAAAGALAGILLAPEKGSETRKKIAGKAGNITDSVKNSFGDFIDSVKGAYAGAREDAEEFGDKATGKMNSLKNEAKNALS
ncbi:MAG: YtxH domain-containing protein [Bacteroidota bacterium]|nr:YtxH domain-containing protein [Chitinophagaceae bacterium]MDZ4807666.1 YtxH domain-containing protein [Bacteroidota bacterium]